MDIFIKNIVDLLKAEIPLSEDEIKGLIENIICALLNLKNKR